jgi:hypothetical protein
MDAGCVVLNWKVRSTTSPQGYREKAITSMVPVDNASPWSFSIVFVIPIAPS